MYWWNLIDIIINLIKINAGFRSTEAFQTGARFIDIQKYLFEYRYFILTFTLRIVNKKIILLTNTDYCAGPDTLLSGSLFYFIHFGQLCSTLVRTRIRRVDSDFILVRRSIYLGFSSKFSDPFLQVAFIFSHFFRDVPINVFVYYN